MDVEQKNKIKKLFDGTLKLEERMELNSNKLVDKALRQQWEEMEAESADSLKEERILNGILRKVHGKRTIPLMNSFYRYGMAAMIAVCMVLSVLLFQENSRQEVIYVMNTGYQSMDSVRLADGTKVMLSVGSKLTYPKEFSGLTREVELSGQAFFDVAPDKEHRFVVKTQKMDVTALGTSFEVFSYDNDNQVETILLEGKVKVEMTDDDSKTGKAYVLNPNEKLTYNKKEGVSLTTLDADAYSSWRLGKRMSFKNETLEMILNRLEKWYGEKIECDPLIARYYRFTFAVHSESLELILNYISHSAPLDYRLVGNEHYVIEKAKK